MKGIILFSLFLFFSPFVLSVECPDSGTLNTVNNPCTVTGTSSIIQLNFNSGFTDNTTIAAIGGNPGTTVGSQRQYSFIKAAEIIANDVVSTVPIIVDAQFSSLSCNAVSATLGSAGASGNTTSPTAINGLPANTWIPLGLYNASSGTDVFPSFSDITADFNTNLGQTGCLQASNGWYYGYDVPSTNFIGFVTVLLHELTHGLGFASLVNASTGAMATDGGGTPRPDVFSNQLFHRDLNTSWVDGSVSNSQRASAAISSTGLLWNGTQVNSQAIGLLSAGFQDNDASSTFTNGDRVQMYAPNPTEAGSSVSHFNTLVSPNELMEPQYTEGQNNLGLSLHALKDMGWSIASGSNTAPTIIAIDQTTDEDTALTVNISTWGSDVDSDALTYSVTSCANNLTCSISANNLTLTPSANVHGATNTVGIQVSDGRGGSANDTFNLTINPMNDAPIWSNIPSQALYLGNSLSLNLSEFSSDVDGDTLAYSVINSDASLNTTISNNLVNLTPSFIGDFVIQVQTDDNNEQVNQSFSVVVYTPLSVSAESSNVSDGDSLIFEGSTFDITFTGGSPSLTASLLYEGNNANHLITASAGAISIQRPNSGAFAGEYSATLSDNETGDSTTLTLTKAPNISLAHPGILEGNNAQVMSITGGTAGTQYSISHSPSNTLTLTDEQGNSITTATSIDDAAAFNPATALVRNNALSNLTQVDVVASSIYLDAELKGINIYPSIEYRLTIVDSEENEILSPSLMLENHDILTEIGINSSHSGDSSGIISILLPTTTLTGTISATGFTSQIVNLSEDLANRQIVLFQSSVVVMLSGTIEAVGQIDFLTAAPAISLTLSDGSVIDIPVSVSSSQNANFSYSQDVSARSLQSLEVTHPDANTASFNLTGVIEDESFSVILSETGTPSPAPEAQPTASAEPERIGSSRSSGGINFGFLMLLAGIICSRKLKFKYLGFK